ncbi:hypothetical protein F4823DRAFT_598083 [Ustulina deusta]|nr:hypothetical protein F4823DRAFT_598083 [Ustulina deusta]
MTDTYISYRFGLEIELRISSRTKNHKSWKSLASELSIRLDSPRRDLGSPEREQRLTRHPRTTPSGPSRRRLPSLHRWGRRINVRANPFICLSHLTSPP